MCNSNLTFKAYACYTFARREIKLGANTFPFLFTHFISNLTVFEPISIAA